MTVLNKFWGVITNQRQSVFAKTWESVQHSGGNDPNKAVNAIMADPDRLLRRSRLRKSFTTRRLGSENNDAEQDEEHYDDTGLYQSILRNLINSKAHSSDPNNTTELNKHWLKLQRLEKKVSFSDCELITHQAFRLKKWMSIQKLRKAERFVTMCIRSSLASFLKQTRPSGLTNEEINFSGVFFNARIIIFLELFTF